MSREKFDPNENPLPGEFLFDNSEKRFKANLLAKERRDFFSTPAAQEPIIKELPAMRQLKEQSTGGKKQTVSQRARYKMTCMLTILRDMLDMGAMSFDDDDEEVDPLVLSMADTSVYNNAAKEADSAEAKLKLTLERLRRLGYLTETAFPDLLNKADELTQGAAAGIVDSWIDIFSVYDLGYVENAVSDHADEIYMHAIELFVFFNAPEMLLNEEADSYTTICRKNIKDIYVFALEAAEKKAVELLVEEYEDEIEELNEKVEHQASSLKEAKHRHKETMKAFKKDDSAEVARLKEQLAKAQEENSALFQEKVKLGRQITALQNELDRLKNGTQEDDTEEEDPRIETPVCEEEPETVEYETPDFPEDGVVFLGGHPNLIKKLRQTHPNWTLVSPDDDRKRNALTYMNTKIKVVICMSKHISHSLFETVTNCMPEDAPILYVSSNNLNALEKQVAEKWKEECIRSGSATPICKPDSAEG